MSKTQKLKISIFRKLYRCSICDSAFSAVFWDKSFKDLKALRNHRFRDEMHKDAVKILAERNQVTLMMGWIRTVLNYKLVIMN